jgi:PAS domain S-box-containing protein
MMNEIESTVLFHVLSLEDSEKDFEIICEKLIDAGYKLDISRVDTESEFINLVQNINYDIILADYNLSGFDAFEALNICKKYCPDVPFICVSGSIGEITAIELLKNGAVDYVLKDRLERLPFAVNRALHEAGYKKEKKQVEQSLQYSEEKYRAIFENVQDVFYQTDLSGIIKEISPSIKYFSDFDATELIGKPVSGIYLNPRERELFFQILSENGEVRDYEIKLKTKFGEIRYGSINARLIFNMNGYPDHIDGSIRDITERIKAEESLRNSEEKFRNLFENHAAVNIILDPDTGEIVDANHAASRFYGWSTDELKQMKIGEINTASQDIIIKTLNQVRNFEKVNFEFQHCCKDGSIKEVEVLGSKIVILEKEFLHAIVHDITTKKKVEQQIRLLSLSIEQSPVMVLITDPQAKIEYVNRSFSETTGYSLEEVKGKNPKILKSGKQPIEFYQKLWNTVLSGQPWSGEFQDRKKDGEIYWVDASISPLMNEFGQITHFVMIKEDISVKRKMLEDLIIAKEKAETSDRLKSSFINNISHEIRTPLNGILGFINILINMDLSPEEKDDYLAMLNSSSDRLVNTVTSFLDISLLASGNQKVYKKEFEVEGFLDETIGKYRNACKEKNLTLSLQIPISETEFKLITDVSLVRKIMNHLIDNSIKFTNQGGISVGYKIDGSDIHFFVKDTGVGIQRENWQQIFGYFMQENSTTNRGYEGSGLGLPIAKGFVELLGGKIWLDSEKGKGTTFFFSIPCEVNQPAEKKKQSNYPGFSADGEKQTILVVEDDNSNFVYISALLKRVSISVLHAEDGFDAILCVQNHPEIKLVLMDLKIPEMDGFEATQQIKLLRNDLPVIAVTAYSGTDDKQKALEAGCDDIITKPLKKEQLFQKIEQFGIRIT